MVDCQKNKCSSSWPPIITFVILYALLIFKPHSMIQTTYPHSHKHTKYQCLFSTAFAVVVQALLLLHIIECDHDGG